jgi:hypothetical protein
MPEPPAAGRHRVRVSPALVIATLALFVALAGTGYAALSIPPKSVGTTQLRNGAVTNAKIVPGAGVTLVYTRATTNVVVGPGSEGGGDAACPKGTFAIGGGVGTNDVSGVTVTETLPFDATTNSYSGAANAWAVFVENAGTQAQTIDVYAVCAAAASATATY